MIVKRIFLKNINLIFQSNNKKYACRAFSSLQLQNEESNSLDIPGVKSEEKLIRVAIIGTPNAGKSTFINNLVDHQVCATSNKVHTTRNSAKAFTVEGNTQIVFVDTPGLVSHVEQKRYNLEKSFLRDCISCMKSADVIGVIHDANNIYTRHRLDSKVIRILYKFSDLPSFLVLNKVDLLKSKRKLLDLTGQLTENKLKVDGLPSKALLHNFDHPNGVWRHFSRIFMVSSLSGDGMQQVKDYLVEISKPSPWLCKSNQYTDQTPEQVIVNTVKATLLDFLPQEIPYFVTTEIEYFERNNNGSIIAMVLVTCPNERIEKLIVGVGSGKLKQITAVAQRTLWQAFHCPVTLKIATLPKISGEKPNRS